MTEAPSTAATASAAPRIPVVAFGLGASLFLTISYVLCIGIGALRPEFGLHRPWLQFLPGFVWLTWPSFLLGLAETFAYGWYSALVFAPLFNFFAQRLR